MIKKSLFLILVLCSSILSAQEHFPKNDGVKSRNTNLTAFTNAQIYVAPSQSISKGTLLIQNGKVVASGTSIPIPPDAVIIDLKGKHIYPSFIDVYSAFGVEKPKPSNHSRTPKYNPSREGFYWNDHIRPEQNAIDYFKFDDISAKTLRKAGFGVVNTHLQDGIIRGTGALIALTDKGGDSERILNPRSGQYSSLNKSVKSHQAYPSSILGSLALLRQVDYDADWYAKSELKTTDRALEAYNANKNLVQFIAAGSRLNNIRVNKVGKDVGIEYVILGGGDEFERITDIKKTNATYIIPVNFPKPYDVEHPFLAETLELSQLREWNQKPANPRIMAENNITFAFTSNGLKSPEMLTKNIRKAIEYGLDKNQAYEALTLIPAKILKQYHTIGSLKNGAFANFLITSGHPFDKETTIYENWIKGNKHILESMTIKDIRGAYSFTIDEVTYDLNIKGEIAQPKAILKSDDNKLDAKLYYKDKWLSLTFTANDTTKQNYIRFVSRVDSNQNLTGKIIHSNGSETAITITKKIDNPNTKNQNTANDNARASVKTIQAITYPNSAYGFSQMPQQETLLFKNATVWTNESDGILANTDVLIKNGKISKIGKQLSDHNAKVIDATGKHLTAGIIDEHSHIATSSVNEGGQNSSAEVSIEDVINPEDINIYRNLAGGVTSIQILHGSANPIGGRSAVIKLKWGASAEDLIYDNSPKFIKFALGENVKQSNRQSYNRFPQTRMGVEQLYIDYFTRAKEYETRKKSGLPYRKDTEMEVLVEVLNGERFISCHSYVQSEINMLMKVADQFDFSVNTFTHILEGYKVADKMKAHGAGGSTFSDWWAYKYEVNDAIPYNAAIMHNAGVTVAINSDDAEMSRRLNQEAAKAIKYGGVSEADAWKFITLNPAKLLHVDHRVGSIKVGKDADIVLWNGHPMSIYTKAEKTIIEGVTYFDIERDQQMRSAIKKEKNTLIGMMLQAKNKGQKTQPIIKQKKHHMHCDTMDDKNH